MVDLSKYKYTSNHGEIYVYNDEIISLEKLTEILTPPVYHIDESPPDNYVKLLYGNMYSIKSTKYGDKLRSIPIYDLYYCALNNLFTPEKHNDACCDSCIVVVPWTEEVEKWKVAEGKYVPQCWFPAPGTESRVIIYTLNGNDWLWWFPNGEDNG